MSRSDWFSNMPAKSLLKTPDLVWDQICDFAGPSSTTALSLVSFRFRRHVMRKKFQRMVIAGDEHTVVHKLQDFLYQTDENRYKDSRLLNPRLYIIEVEIIILPMTRATGNRISHPGKNFHLSGAAPGSAVNTPYIILNTISCLKSLNILHLDLEHMDVNHKPIFIGKLSIMAGWRFSHLTLTSSSEIAEAIIKNCTRLVTFQYYPLSAPTGILKLLKRHHPGLRRFHYTNLWTFQGGAFPSMNTRLLDLIFQHLKGITWLCIDDCGRRYFPRASDGLEKFTISRDRLVTALQRFPDLEYFSFTIPESESNILRQAEATNPEDLEFNKTEAGIDQWYLSLAKYVAEAVPRLKKVCIKGRHPVVYSATRKSSGQPLVLEITVANRGTRAFPWTVLMANHSE